MQQVLATKWAKTFDLINLGDDADKLDIDKLKNVPINWKKLNSKVDKLDLDRSVSVPVDFKWFKWRKKEWFY